MIYIAADVIDGLLIALGVFAIVRPDSLYRFMPKVKGKENQGPSRGDFAFIRILAAVILIYAVALFAILQVSRK